MSYLMNKELGQAILNYLGAQPYAQVAEFIQGLQQMGEINDQEFAEYMSIKNAAQDSAAEAGHEAVDTVAEEAD